MGVEVFSTRLPDGRIGMLEEIGILDGEPSESLGILAACSARRQGGWRGRAGPRSSRV